MNGGIGERNGRRTHGEAAALVRGLGGGAWGTGRRRWEGAALVAGFDTFRQVAWAGSFEGQTTLALGARARLPFRVLTLDGTPSSDHTPRLVIDVAHRW